MKSFGYARAADVAEAISLDGGRHDSRYLGGGTNLVDLMRENIERPRQLVDVSNLSDGIEVTADGRVNIGAAVTNTALAENRHVRENFPMLSRAILAGASAQIRNMATVGGNLLQRTRCCYFYDQAAKCNKRATGTGCDAIGGFNRIHAILGASHDCIATHPSDMCVALAALDAQVLIEGPAGSRRVALTDLHRLPGDAPDRDTILESGELITAIELTPTAAARNSSYRKVRDRASYAFALVSVAAALQLEGGVISDVRIALGGVAAKPWRARKAEAVLTGQEPTIDAFQTAASAELENAQPLRDNGFKVELARRVMVASLQELSA